MLYSPVKFRLTVVKLYNYDPNDAEDIVYTEGPACPGRLEVRIPAAAAPLAAIIPTAETLLIIPTAAASLIIPTAAIYPSPATSPDQARPVSLARVVSDVMINKD